MGNYFDIKKDLETVRDGGFMCNGCLVGKPKDDQSPDPRYCLSCYAFLLAEATLLSPNRAKPKWVPVAAETPPEGAVAKQKQREVVTKIVDKGIIPVQTKTGIMLHKKTRGRPSKPVDEPVSRMTKWRRKKELQGVLV